MNLESISLRENLKLTVTPQDKLLEQINNEKIEK